MCVALLGSERLRAKCALVCSVWPPWEVRGYVLSVPPSASCKAVCTQCRRPSRSRVQPACCPGLAAPSTWVLCCGARPSAVCVVLRLGGLECKGLRGQERKGHEASSPVALTLPLRQVPSIHFCVLSCPLLHRMHLPSLHHVSSLSRTLRQPSSRPGFEVSSWSPKQFLLLNLLHSRSHMWSPKQLPLYHSVAFSYHIRGCILIAICGPDCPECV